MKRKKIMIGTTIAILFIALVIFLYYLFVLRFEEYTDDAYVHGNLVELTPPSSRMRLSTARCFLFCMVISRLD